MTQRVRVDERADPFAGRGRCAAAGHHRPRAEAEHGSAVARRPGVRSYDISSQERIVRGRMPNLEIINERFARNIRLGLFNLIHKSAEISIGGIKVQKYSAFLREIVVPTNFNIMSVRPLRGSGLIVCDPSLVFAVDRRAVRRHRQAATRASRAATSRPPSSASSSASSSVIATEYKQAWAGVYPLQLELPALGDAAAVREHRHRRARSWSRPSFAMEIGETSGSDPLLHSVLDARADPRRPLLDDPGRRQRAGPALGLADEAADPGGRGRARGRAGAGAGDGRASCSRSSRATSSSSTCSAACRPRWPACRCSTATTAPRTASTH